jgi:hypothetical protein
MEGKSCVFEVSYMAFLRIVVYRLHNLIPTLIFISVNHVTYEKTASKYGITLFLNELVA